MNLVCSLNAHSDLYFDIVFFHDGIPKTSSVAPFKLVSETLLQTNLNSFGSVSFGEPFSCIHKKQQEIVFALFSALEPNVKIWLLQFRECNFLRCRSCGAQFLCACKLTSFNVDLKWTHTF